MIVGRTGRLFHLFELLRDHAVPAAVLVPSVLRALLAFGAALLAVDGPASTAELETLVAEAIGPESQLGTVQVDYNLPERFDLTYTGADNATHRPVMVHRAPFGSFERFVGILIEHFEGAFPTWLSPEQARVLPISEKHVEYGEKVYAALKSRGIRVTMDDSNERVNAKIKVGAEEKIPYLLIVGGKDAEAGTVSVRQRGVGDRGAVGLEDFLTEITSEIQEKKLPPRNEEPV